MLAAFAAKLVGTSLINPQGITTLTQQHKILPGMEVMKQLADIEAAIFLFVQIHAQYTIPICILKT